MKIVSATLAVAVALAASVASALAGETITIRGKTYTVVPDEEMEKLGFRFARPRPEENAALDYLEAIERCQPPDKEIAYLHDYTWGEGWIQDSAALMPYLKANRGVLDLLRGAATKPSCHFPFLKGPRDELPFLAATPYTAASRDLARFALVNARRFEFDGRFAEALDTCRVTLHLGRHFSRDPMLVLDLNCMAIYGMALDTLRDIVFRNDIDAGTLRDFLKRAIPAISDHPSLQDTMANERIYYSHLLEELLRSPERIRDVGFRRSDKGAFNSRLATLLARVPGFQRRMRVHMRRFWNLMDETSAMSLPEFMEEGKASIEQFSEGVPAWSVVGAFRYLGDIRLRYARREVQGNLMIAAIALQLYRKEHGAFPANLDALHEYLDPVPNDLYTGQPLRYRIEGKGWVLYSVGENLEDDGGQRGKDLVIAYPLEAPPTFEEYVAKWGMKKLM